MSRLSLVFLSREFDKPLFDTDNSGFANRYFAVILFQFHMIAMFRNEIYIPLILRTTVFLTGQGDSLEIMNKELKTRLGLKNVTSDMVRFYVNKSLYQLYTYRSGVDKVICPVFACQRSGTSLMLRVFFWDKDTVVYREGSSLSSQDPLGLRLDPIEDVAKKIRENRAPLVVLKPIVDSQNARQFLEAMPEAKSIWLYRNYRDVVSSNLRKFGERNGINDIRSIAQNDPNNWRSENVSDYTRSIVQTYFSEDMPPNDAAALFWYVRNQLFFEQDLDGNSRVLLVRYSDFVTNPAETMPRIYKFLGRPYPGDHINREVHDLSVGKGKEVMLSIEIEDLCQSQLERLEDAEANPPV